MERLSKLSVLQVLGSLAAARFLAPGQGTRFSATFRSDETGAIRCDVALVREELVNCVLNRDIILVRDDLVPDGTRNTWRTVKAENLGRMIAAATGGRGTGYCLTVPVFRY